VVIRAEPKLGGQIGNAWQEVIVHDFLVSGLKPGCDCHVGAQGIVQPKQPAMTPGVGLMATRQNQGSSEFSVNSQQVGICVVLDGSTNSAKLIDDRGPLTTAVFTHGSVRLNVAVIPKGAISDQRICPD